MIYVDRSTVSNPLHPYTELGQKAFHETDEIGKIIESVDARQRHLIIKAYRHKIVKDALIELFHGKCAYCESLIVGTQSMDIEQYRPKGSVLEASDRPGYWWLANEWDNLLVACAGCIRISGGKEAAAGKGNRFPLIDEKERAFDPQDKLDRER